MSEFECAGHRSLVISDPGERNAYRVDQAVIYRSLNTTTTIRVALTWIGSAHAFPSRIFPLPNQHMPRLLESESVPGFMGFCYDMGRRGTWQLEEGDGRKTVKGGPTLTADGSQYESSIQINLLQLDDQDAFDSLDGMDPSNNQMVTIKRWPGGVQSGIRILLPKKWAISQLRDVCLYHMLSVLLRHDGSVYRRLTNN